MLRTSGTNVQSGNNVTTIFQIPHGLPFIPISCSVTPGSVAAATDSSTGVTGAGFYVNVNFTDIVITYPGAPTVGTNNLTWFWSAECN